DPVCCSLLGTIAYLLRNSIDPQLSLSPSNRWPNGENQSDFRRYAPRLCLSLSTESFSGPTHCPSQPRDRCHTWNELDERALCYHQHHFSHHSTQPSYTWFSGHSSF